MQVVTNCQSCGKSISAEQVKPGEGDTTPWYVWLPRGHVSSVDDLPDRMHYRCPKTLDRHIFFLPKTNPVQDELDLTPERIERAMRKAGMLPEKVNGDVKHETWLEYHDRLVKEYYDVDAEWALVKEICPELDRPEPTQAKRPALVVPLMIGAAMNSLLATIAFVFDQFVVGVLGYALMCALLWGARSL